MNGAPIEGPWGLDPLGHRGASPTVAPPPGVVVPAPPGHPVESVAHPPHRGVRSGRPPSTRGRVTDRVSPSIAYKPVDRRG